MSDTDFLKKVQPAGGWTVIVGINPANKDDVQHRFAQTDIEIEREIDRFKALGFHTYYGVAKYTGFEGRETKYVQGVQSFWLDIDCTPGKGYDNKADGQAALDAFVAKLGLPTPITVDSGNGIHAYWPLTEEVDPLAWRAVCDALKARCRAEGLNVDPSVMEAARIMRVPGSLNHKSNPPLPVTEIQSTVTPITLADFAAKVGTATPKPGIFGKSGPRRGPSKMGLAIVAGSGTYAPADFGKVAAACQHIAYCVDNRATLSEPLWRAALSVANRCTEPDAAIAAVSEGWVSRRSGETYDFDAAKKKADETKGPYTCNQFSDLTEPGTPGCIGCPFKTTTTDDTGKIIDHYVLSSPIRLGEAQFMGGNTTRTQPLPDDNALPSFPKGYYRRPGEDGGVMLMNPDPKQSRDILIYKNDLYLTQRLRSARDDVYAYTLCMHTPHDPMEEILLYARDMGSNAVLKPFLCEKGVIFNNDAHFALVKTYISAFMAHIETSEKAIPMYEQFGWVQDDSKFIIGDQEFHGVKSDDGTIKAHVTSNPPSPITRPFVSVMHTCGTLQNWKDVFKLYGKPDMELHAFTALTGFGAPLFKFLGYSGAVIHLISPNSGIGKTTVLRMINSIYGHPDKLMSGPDDTYNARIAKLGIHNNLPFTADELTNMLPEDVSKMVYSMTQGKGKDRMQGTTNALRENNTTWQTISVCSSNASFASKLQSIKSSPDGELMRLLEFNLDQSSAPIDLAAKELMDVTLAENYGHAGRLFIASVIENQPAIIRALRETQAKLINELKAEQHERFWIAVITVNLIAGQIAKQIGLIDWNIGKIRAWAIKQFYLMRQERTQSLVTAEGVLGAFLNLNFGKLLVVAPSKSPMQATMIPTNNKVEVILRYETDTKKLYVVKKIFENFCVERNIDYKATVKELSKLQILTAVIEKKRMTSGLGFTTSGVSALEFDHTHPSFSAYAVGT